jgi:ferredoxin
MTMNDDSRYDLLRKKLSDWPVKLPKSPEIIEILKMLFTTDEVELILSKSFTAPYKDRKTVLEISKELNRPKEGVETILNALADKGVVFRFFHEKDKKTYYSIFPILPGFFEFYLVGEKNEDNRKKFSGLIEKYYLSDLMAEIGSSTYPWVRVLPSEKTLNVDIDLDTTPEILPFEKVTEFINTSRKIALMNCACRVKSSCEHQLETCMCFDNYADYMVQRGLARYLTLEEAVNKLDEFEEQGLVHTTTNCQSRPQFICNCCTCSCLVLRGLVEFDNPRSFSKSNFVPQWYLENCNNCDLCIDICPVDALRFTDTPGEHVSADEQDQLVVNEERCIGCGLCASNCDPEALMLVKVREDIPEGTLRGMWMRTDIERVQE